MLQTGVGLPVRDVNLSQATHYELKVERENSFEFYCILISCQIKMTHMGGVSVKEMAVTVTSLVFILKQSYLVPPVLSHRRT